MRSFSSAFLIMLLALCAVSAARAAETLYTCGMHPQIIKKEPGNCPICGMKLTPIRANATAPGPAAANANTIQIDAATIQRMNLKTAIVTRGPVRREIRTVGTIAYNEQGLRDITTKYEGWIEKLFVNATWTAIKAGDPLFEIYSPDLYNAQLNYVVALRTEGDASGPLTRAALGRLQLFDVPENFIREFARRGEASRTLVFRAPTDGVVIEKAAVVGQMMKPGERIYRLADLSSVWVLAQIYEKDLPFVRTGDPVTIRSTYGGTGDITGKVALLLPQIEEQTRTATARIEVLNPHAALRPGMFVDVRASTQVAAAAVLVPEIAVLRSGERNTVFVARDGGTFEPREVKLGARNDDGRYEVLAGLAEGDRVVTSGQFMLDSESQLREAIQKMMKTDHASAANTPAPVQPTEPLRHLVLLSADAAAALGADDFAGYQKQLPGLRAALAAFLESPANAAENPLAKFKSALPDRPDLKAARQDFAPFSTAVADVAQASHLHHTEKLHVFECPMASPAGKGRWVQRTAAIKNPFFGSEMPTCGEELK